MARKSNDSFFHRKLELMDITPSVCVSVNACTISIELKCRVLENCKLKLIFREHIITTHSSSYAISNHKHTHTLAGARHTNSLIQKSLDPQFDYGRFLSSCYHLQQYIPFVFEIESETCSLNRDRGINDVLLLHKFYWNSSTISHRAHSL